MFEDLLKAVRGLSDAELLTELPPEIANKLPPTFNYGDIRANLLESKSWGDVDSLRALLICLKSNQLENEGGSEDADGSDAIAESVARAILPTTGPSTNASGTDWKKRAQKGQVGLTILGLVSSEGTTKLDHRVLLSVAAFANPTDPWTTKDISALSNKLLKSQLSSSDARTKFITETILDSFLRPLFSKSRPATVTASGRKAEFVEASRYDSTNSVADETKQWKHGHRYAVSVFEWAVGVSDEELLSKHWHMFTPVLFTLLDESQTDIKIRALCIFSAFWARCPSDLMRKAGLAEVFEQAVFPAALFLPTLTPEDESIRVLNVTYPALFQIAGLAYPESRIGEPTTQPEFSNKQKDLLDKIIREGLMVGYHHASQHIRLVELICEKARFAVNGMGILAVKHLKDLIPMISEIMTDPFGTKYPPAVLEANGLLRTILRCCWPRIPSYCNDIIKILTVCWLNVEDEDSLPNNSTGRDKLRSELNTTATVLSAIMRAQEPNLAERVSPLIEKEPLLGALFTPGRTNPSTS